MPATANALDALGAHVRFNIDGDPRLGGGWQRSTTANLFDLLAGLTEIANEIEPPHAGKAAWLDLVHEVQDEVTLRGAWGQHPDLADAIRDRLACHCGATLAGDELAQGVCLRCQTFS